MSLLLTGLVSSAEAQETHANLHSERGGRLLVFGGLGVPDLLYMGLAIESENLVLRGQIGGAPGIFTGGGDINVHFGP